MNKNNIIVQKVFDDILAFDYHDEEYLDNCNGIFHSKRKQFKEFPYNVKAQKFIESLDTNIVYHTKIENLCYQFVNNIMDVLKPEYFMKPEYYYYCMFHEIAHWTGDFFRTERCAEYISKYMLKIKITAKEKKEYLIREEVFAYIMSYLLCQKFKIELDLGIVIGSMLFDCYFDYIEDKKQFLDSIRQDILDALKYLKVRF